MIGMSCGPCGNGAQKVASHDDIGRSTADAFAGTLSKWVDSARAHIAVAAAEPQLPEAALWLLFVKAIPGGLHASARRHGKHLLTGGIYGSVLIILGHIIPL
jgi:hypothetical protein